MGLDLVGSYYLGKQLREASDAAKQAREDTAARRAVTADVEPVIKEASDGMGPSAVMVGKDAYGTEQDAGKAAQAYNAPDAKIARLQGVMLNQADPEGAMKLEKSNTDMKAYRQKAAKAMEDEGITTFIDTNLGAAPSVADIEAGKAGAFDLQGADDFNKTGGKVTIPNGAKGQWKVMDYGNGRKEADFEVLGPDGKPLAPSARTLQAIHAMSLHEREKQADDRIDKARDNDRADKQLKGQLDYWKAMADKAEKWQPGGTGGSKGGGSLFDRMDQNDLEAYKSAAKLISSIQEGVIKSTGDGTWDPSKNSAQQALLLQKAQLEKQAQAIMSKYGEQDAPGAGKSDPYGIRGGAGGAGSSNGTSPDSDRSAILKSEYSKAIAARDAAQPGSPEWTRAQGDVQALANELRSAGASAQAPAAGGAQPKPRAAASPARAGLVMEGNALAPGKSALTGLPASMLPIVNRRTAAQNGIINQIGEATRKRQQ